MKRTATPTFVLSIPLVVKPGEDRILIGRMESGRRLYNATLGEALRRHGLMKQSKAWQYTCTLSDKKLRKGIAPSKHAVAGGSIVGLDIGPGTLAVVGDNSASLVKFCETVVQPWKETRRLQRAMDRSKRATNPQCFNANGTWKKGQKFTPSKRYMAIRTEYAEVERKLAAERKRAHGELANQILELGHVIQSETLSYRSFQKNYGKSVKVRALGMFVEQLCRKAESAGGKLVDLHTWSLKMSQYDHTTEVGTKKPLSQRWHVLGDGSGVVQRDVYSAFLARSVMGNTHHPSHIEAMWAAQKPVLLQTGWLRLEPAKIEPSGKITVATPLDRVVCKRGLAIGHSRDVVAVMREPDGFALRTPCL